jgi:hypothetical protein
MTRFSTNSRLVGCFLTVLLVSLASANLSAQAAQPQAAQPLAAKATPALDCSRPAPGSKEDNAARDRWKQMTPAQQEARRAEMRKCYQQMTPEQQAEVRKTMDERRQKRESAQQSR